MSGNAASAQADAPTAQRLAVRKVRALTLAIAAVAIAVVVLGSGSESGMFEPTRSGHWWIFAFIVGGYALATRFVFHVEFRRDSISFSMFESSVALALVFLSPVVGVAVRVIVCVALISITSRPPLYKTLFNAALFALQTALAYAIVRAIVGTDHLSDSRLLIGVAVALTVTGFLNSLLVAWAISCFEGGYVKRLVNATRTSLMESPVSGTLATVTLAPALVRLEFAFFAVVPVVAVWFVLQQHGRLAQNHRNLEAVHGFSAVVGSSLDVQVIADTALVEAMRLLRSDRGALQVYGREGELVAVSNSGVRTDTLPSGRTDPAWHRMLDFDGAARCGMNADGSVLMDGHGRQNALSMPIRDGDSVVGMIIVADRAGADGSFDSADISRAATLVGQLALSLRRALLHADMEHAALHDRLTGQPNRLGFERELRDVAMWGRGLASAVIMLDLNRFKEVNDTLGHHVGDRVLIEFCNRIARQLGPDDVLARFGGDEFALLVSRSNTAEITDLANRILAESFTPMPLDDLDVVVTASIGIAPILGNDAVAVLRQADIAMYHAKRESTEIEVYRDEIDCRSPERLALLGSLREALDIGSLEVHYQPKVDMVTSTIIGTEALVRWCHPTRGWIPPIDFIQVAEESGIIKQVTDQVLRLAVGAVADWAASGNDLSVAVNLSAHDLLDENLPQRIEDLLADHGVSPHKLALEITESALLADTPRTANTIDRLNRLGVRLSLDDFGTGYSSLGYLRRLPVSELKVDQSFVKNMLFDDQDAAIVRSTIDLAHNLGLQVVAEGIENMQTFERLKEYGCDIGQGYGIARPLSPEHFKTWLQNTEYSLPRPVLNDLL